MPADGIRLPIIWERQIRRIAVFWAVLSQSRRLTAHCYYTVSRPIPMSALGQKRTFCDAGANVRFTPISSRQCARSTSPLCARNGLMHRSKPRLYSITSSARASSVGGISRPSAFAVVKFTARSNLVGCSTGMSPGFAPRRIRSTKSAARRYSSGKLGP